MFGKIKPEVVAYLAPAGEASMNNEDHVITEAEFARKLNNGGIIQDTVKGAYSVPLVSLFAYEELQAEFEYLAGALGMIANMDNKSYYNLDSARITASAALATCSTFMRGRENRV